MAMTIVFSFKIPAVWERLSTWRWWRRQRMWSWRWWRRRWMRTRTRWWMRTRTRSSHLRHTGSLGVSIGLTQHYQTKMPQRRVPREFWIGIKLPWDHCDYCNINQQTQQKRSQANGAHEIVDGHCPLRQLRLHQSEHYTMMIWDQPVSVQFSIGTVTRTWPL